MTWTSLTRRFGGEVRSPTVDDLAKAVREIYDESYDHLTEADLAAHPDALLRRGDGAGALAVRIDRRGVARLERWADAEATTPAEAARTVGGVTAEEALRLLALLRDGELHDLGEAFSA